MSDGIEADTGARVANGTFVQAIDPSAGRGQRDQCSTSRLVPEPTAGMRAGPCSPASINENYLAVVGGLHQRKRQNPPARQPPKLQTTRRASVVRDEWGQEPTHGCVKKKVNLWC